VYENGSLEDKTVIYFNLQQALRGIPKGPEREMLLMQRVCCHSVRCALNHWFPTWG